MDRYEDYTDRLAEVPADYDERIDRLVEDEAPFFPPTCADSPQECEWSEEQEGYEEQARTVRVCATHGTEVR